MGAQTRSEKIDHAPLVGARGPIVEIIFEAVTSSATNPNT
jgi:hypothetical protein